MFDYSRNELMLISAARLLHNGGTVLVGVGLPNIACNLAQKTHAPNLTLIYESGVIGAQPTRLPLSIGDPSLANHALAIESLFDIFSLYLQTGLIDVGFLGCAQIDQYANINSTVIGNYKYPKTRLPGSGGAKEIASWVKRTIVITKHSLRKFPQRVDFHTSGGAFSLPKNTNHSSSQANNVTVVTDLGILNTDDLGELQLSSIHPGVSFQEIQANTSWKLKTSHDLHKTKPPTKEELRALRSELNSEEFYSKRIKD